MLVPARGESLRPSLLLLHGVGKLWLTRARYVVIEAESKWKVAEMVLKPLKASA